MKSLYKSEEETTVSAVSGYALFKIAEEGASRTTGAEWPSIARHSSNMKKRTVCLVGVVADMYIISNG